MITSNRRIFKSLEAYKTTVIMYTKVYTDRILGSTPETFVQLVIHKVFLVMKT